MVFQACCSNREHWDQDAGPRMEDPGQSTKDGRPLEESGTWPEDQGWITQLDKGWWMQRHEARAPRIDDQEHECLYTAL